jgi:hypothetical protein
MRRQNAPVAVGLSPEAYQEVADIETIHTIDYGSFVWLELNTAGFEDLLASGVEFERQPDPTVLSIQGYTIDTNEPSTSLIDDGDRGFHLFQFIGPTKDAWLNELAGLRVEVLQYFQPHAYLARMTSEQAFAAAELSFVRWVGPYLPEYRASADLLERSGIIENVVVTIYDDGAANATIRDIAAFRGSLVEQETARSGEPFLTAKFRLPATALESVCELDKVVWLSYRPPVDALEDEMSDQIIAGNFFPMIPGYQNWLNANGVNGAGITVALVDTGYDTGVDVSAHPDLSGRLIPVGTPTDGNGHGTHVGGIMAGNATLGTVDGRNFLLGLGVAPNASMVVRFFDGNDADRTKDSVTRGAVASNNSYGLHGASIGYTNVDRTYDILVRDADLTTTVAEPLIIVFSAGNCGNAPPGGPL